MSNEFKLVPGIWHPINAINDKNRYEPSFLLHCPDLICSDFNPSGVVEGHWCDDEGWHAAVWCGYHDEFHTKFVTPTLIMVIPSIAAPQPTALGGEPEVLMSVRAVLGGLTGLCYETIKPLDAPTVHGKTLELIDRAYLAPLQAEIASERELRRELGVRVHQLKDELKDVAHIKARNAELERLLQLSVLAVEDMVQVHSGQGDALSEQACIDLASAIRGTVYKPAGSEQ